MPDSLFLLLGLLGLGLAETDKPARPPVMPGPVIPEAILTEVMSGFDATEDEE